MTLLVPGSREFIAKFSDFQYSVFRLETLQSYANSGEDAALEAFLAGQPLPPRDPFDDEWEAMIRGNVHAGRSVQRVHVVREPVTDYIAYELTWGYGPNVAAGENIRVIPVAAGEPWPVDLPPEGADYFLFDSHELFWQHYDVTGRWLGTEPVSDAVAVVNANRWRDAAWHRGIPWHSYIEQRPGLARRLPPAAWWAS